MQYIEIGATQPRRPYIIIELLKDMRSVATLMDQEKQKLQCDISLLHCVYSIPVMCL